MVVPGGYPVVLTVYVICPPSATVTEEGVIECVIFWEVSIIEYKGDSATSAVL